MVARSKLAVGSTGLIDLVATALLIFRFGITSQDLLGGSMQLIRFGKAGNYSRTFTRECCVIAW